MMRIIQSDWLQFLSAKISTRNISACYSKKCKIKADLDLTIEEHKIDSIQENNFFKLPLVSILIYL
jgi:hypothetical protein